MNRCRICTSNDREALIDELAAELWFNESDGRLLAEAGVQWQIVFRQFAERTLRTIERGHDR